MRSTIFKKIVVPSNIVSPPQQATTLSPEITTIAYFSVPLIIVGAVSFLLCLLFVIVLSIICRKIYCNRKSEQKKNSSTVDDLAKLAGFPQPMTSHNAPRKWNQSSPTLECSPKQDTVVYSRNNENRSTISTISGSLHSFEDIILLKPNTLSRNDSSYA
ncbi:uncharacterized protein LOC127736822 [Mytilus californianus]|uniref:uncharacterized protein LOC127736822 n=1 Tax=Mytilus californianus TaxID=6549 RepID=UPI002247E4A6|nr:uncharacterized protein LOC127736822 [Mytilus californianus]